MIAACITAVLTAVLALGGPVPGDAATRPASGRDMPGIETTGHGVVVSSALPHCLSDDGENPGPSYPCTWNVRPGRDGDGRGAAYIMRRPGVLDYVWPHSPARNGWTWTGPRADCVARAGIERCPDGTRHPYDVSN